MTIPATTRVSPIYNGNASATVFAFGYKTYAKQELQVTVSDGITQQTLILDSDYSVALNADQVTSPGGSITYPLSGSPLAVGLTLVIVSAVPNSQDLSLPTGGAFNAASVELGLDRLQVQIQQIQDLAGRAIVVPEYGSPVTLPSALTRAGFLLGFDSVGNIALVAAAAQSATALALSLLSNAGSSLITFLQAGAGAIGMTLQTLLRQIVTTKQYGAVANGVTNDAAAVLAASNQAVAIGAPLVLQGVHHIGTPITITAPIVDTMAQIFSLTSQVTIDNGQPVRPEWWGIGNENTVHLAGLSLPTKGGTVLLSNATYKRNNHVYDTGAGGKYWSKANVKFVGAQMPTFTGDCKALTGGTIIQGTWLSFANGCEYRDVGFDVGYTFTQGIGGGVANDAFSATYPSDAIKAANGLVLGLRVHNLVGLCNGPADAFHAVILAEGTSNVEATGHVIGMYGIHGIIIKAAGVRAEQLIAYCNNSDGVIIKTDTQTTAVANDIQIDRIASHNSGPTGFAPYAVGTNVAGSLSAGMRLHAFGGSVGKVQIGSINESNHDLGIDPVFGGAFTIDNVQIGSITTDGNATTGGNWVANAAGNVFKRCQVGQMVNRNAPNGSICVWTTASDIKFGSVTGVNCSNAAVAVSASATPIFDTLIAESCGAAWQITSSGKPRCGKVILTGTTAAYYQAAGSGQVPALSNSWTQVAGGDTFNVLTTGYGIELNGLISPGSSNVPMTLPQFAWPPTEKRFMLQGRAGATQAAVPVVISTAGVVTINDVAGGTANATNYLSLAGISYPITN